MTIAVMLAGGLGSRFAGNQPKQLHTLSGLPILFYSFRAFDLAPEVDEIVVVAHPGWLDDIREIAETALRKTPWRVIPGGESRNHSVDNALQTLAEGEATILFHDGVRPLVSLDLISRSVAALGPGVDAVLPVIPVSDIIVDIDGHSVGQFLDRSRLRRGQSPQVFRGETLTQAFRGASDDELRASTSIYEVLQLHGGKPNIVTVEGDDRNIKVTFPLDRSIAQHLLASLD